MSHKLEIPRNTVYTRSSELQATSSTSIKGRPLSRARRGPSPETANTRNENKSRLHRSGQGVRKRSIIINPVRTNRCSQGGRESTAYEAQCSTRHPSHRVVISRLAGPVSPPSWFPLAIFGPWPGLPEPGARDLSRTYYLLIGPTRGTATFNTVRPTDIQPGRNTKR